MDNSSDLCSCNATLRKNDAVVSAKNPKKLPEPKDPKTTPDGVTFIYEFMSEAESFGGEDNSYCANCLRAYTYDEEDDAYLYANHRLLKRPYVST